MPANTTLAEAPTATPNAMSLMELQDVWFEWSLTNSGDEDDTTTGWYWVLSDPNQNMVTSDFAPDDSLVAGQTNRQGARVDAGWFTYEGTWWISIRDPNGTEVGSASVLIAPQSEE